MFAKLKNQQFYPFWAKSKKQKQGGNSSNLIKFWQNLKITRGSLSPACSFTHFGQNIENKTKQKNTRVNSSNLIKFWQNLAKLKNHKRKSQKVLSNLSWAENHKGVVGGGAKLHKNGRLLRARERKQVTTGSFIILTLYFEYSHDAWTWHETIINRPSILCMLGTDNLIGGDDSTSNKQTNEQYCTNVPKQTQPWPDLHVSHSCGRSK